MITRQPTGVHALVVEPDPAARAMLAHLLERHGYAVSQAEDFATALAAFTQESSALVIVAERLGTRSGLDLLQILHTRPHAPGGIIVGRRALLNAQTALRGGADDYVARPVEETDLLVACEHALAVRAARHKHARLTTRLEHLQTAFIHVVHTVNFTAQNRLAAYIAHEINNPLTPILGLAEMLLDDLAPNDPRSSQVMMIIAAVQRIRTVVQHMTDFARPLTPQRTVLDLAGLARSVLALSEQRLCSAGIVPSVRAPQRAVRCLGSAAQLTGALLHLIDNAYDAMPHGGTVTLDITREMDTPDSTTLPQAARQHAIISIRDSGVGIARQHQPYIFDLFYSTKTQLGPVGVGLPLAQTIIAAHGGTLTFTTSDGQGSTFVVRLPLYTEGA